MTAQNNLLDVIDNPKTRFTVRLQPFIGTDTKVDKLVKSETSLKAFVEALTPSDPYQITQLGPLNFVLQAKNKPINPLIALTSENLEALWDHKAELLEVYPKLANDFKKLQQEIGMEGCDDCSKKAKGMKLMPIATGMEPVVQNLSKLESFLGTHYVNC